MLSWIAKKILKLLGWTIYGELPKLKKYVAIAAPHTSNWDFLMFMLLKFSLQMKANFVAKHTLFVGPFGWFLNKVGGRALNREKTENTVDAIADLFDKHEEFIFAIAPEGTRSYKKYWKSGFYFIAVKAQVPIQLCFLDSEKKQLGFGPLLEPSGDLEKDHQKLIDFYQDKKGIKPELFSDIAFQTSGFKTKENNH